MPTESLYEEACQEVAKRETCRQVLQDFMEEVVEGKVQNQSSPFRIHSCTRTAIKGDIMNVAIASEQNKREQQQDRATAFEEAGSLYLVIADGMGGHRGGAEAASRVVKSLQQQPETLNSDGLKQLSTSLYEAGRKNYDFYDMGCTLDAVKITGNQATWFHVGDSRIWLYRNGELIDITFDHTCGGVLYQEKSISREAYDAGEYYQGLLAYMGSPPAYFTQDAGSIELEEGDILLLTTDGVHGPENCRTWMAAYLEMFLAQEASKEEQEEEADPLFDCAVLMIQAAIAAGSTDNATAVLYKHCQECVKPLE